MSPIIGNYHSTYDGHFHTIFNFNNDFFAANFKLFECLVKSALEWKQMRLSENIERIILFRLCIKYIHSLKSTENNSHH
jgi:hypothetical protein